MGGIELCWRWKEFGLGGGGGVGGVGGGGGGGIVPSLLCRSSTEALDLSLGLGFRVSDDGAPAVPDDDDADDDDFFGPVSYREG